MAVLISQGLVWVIGAHLSQTVALCGLWMLFICNWGLLGLGEGEVELMHWSVICG